MYLALVRKLARVLVSITSGAVVFRSYGGYLVANSTRNSPNSEPTLPRVANCYILACRGPQLQSSGNSRDEFTFKKISARDSSNALVAPPSSKNEIAHSTHCCRFPSFERCAVKQFRIRRTVARALDVLVSKPLLCNITAFVNESCATPLSTAVVCVRDFAALYVPRRTELNSELDLTSTRPVSCAHCVIRDNLLVTIAHVDTRVTSRHVPEYNTSRTPRIRHLKVNFASLLFYSRRISRLTSLDYSTSMALLLDPLDIAEIIAAASFDAISVKDARN